MQVDLRILRYDPERDEQPHWESYSVEADPKLDRVLDLLHRVKWEQDGTLTFRRSCAHGVCGSDAMLINGRNRLACKLRVEQLGTRRITVAPLPGLPVVKDLVVDMDGFFDKLRSVQPFLINDEACAGARAAPVRGRPGGLRRHDQVHPVRGVHHVLPVVLGAAVVRRPGGHRRRPSVHLRLARRGRRRAPRDPGRQGRGLALPDDLQLHRRLSARDQDHPGDPRGERGDRGARGLSEPFFPELEAAPRVADRGPGFLIRTDGAARGNPGPASLGAALYRPAPARCPRPASPARRLDLRVPRYPDQQRGGVHRDAAGARAGPRAGRPAGRPAPRLEADRGAAHRPLAGQGRQAHPALDGLPSDPRRRSSAGPPATSRAPRTRSPTRWPTRRSTGSRSVARRSSWFAPEADGRPRSRRPADARPAGDRGPSARLGRSAGRSDGRAPAGQTGQGEESPSSSAQGGG